MSRLHPAFKQPVVKINDASLNSWRFNQLADAEASLTEAIRNSQSPTHHALASRALVRARLLQWDQAIADATEVVLHLLSQALILIHVKSIKIEPTVIGYIAKSMALAGEGEKQKAYRACDIALERFHSNHVTFLLLVKVCSPRASWLR